MELRQLRAFVAVGTELHFGHAAEKLFISPTTLSELIRRLEAELTTPLFIRTTRRVQLTAAGSELLERAQSILAEVDSAVNAVQQIAHAETGVIRLGITPPVAPVLSPHLIACWQSAVPLVTVEVRRMWLPGLLGELRSGAIDIAITCGVIETPDEVVSEELAAEELLVGLRPGHRLAAEESVSLTDLADDVLGIASEELFPAWVLSQHQALETAGVAPRVVELADTDLGASHWADQPEIDFVLLISSLSSEHRDTAVKPVRPSVPVPFNLHWVPSRQRAPAVARVVELALTADPPPGWTAAVAGP